MSLFKAETYVKKYVSISVTLQMSMSLLYFKLTTFWRCVTVYMYTTYARPLQKKKNNEQSAHKVQKCNALIECLMYDHPCTKISL